MKEFFDPCARRRRDICLLAGGALPEAERTILERHLAICTGCRKYSNEIKTVTAPLKNWEEDFAHVQPSQTAQDRWTQAIKAAGRPAPVPQLTPALAFRQWCQDVLWPYRRIWSGLAAIWILMTIVNFSQRDHSTIAVTNSTSGAEMASFHDQQKLLNELLADRSLPVEADRPKTYSPKPRTEAVKLFNV